MKRVIFALLGILLIPALTVFWYLSRFGGDELIPEISQETLTDTQSGPVVGFIDDGVNVWLGIPYAKPPTGDLRWRAPRAVEPWDTPKPAIKFGDECPQGMLGASGNEDCLYLNIWSADSESAAKPVMFFIHGGGNVFGSADAGGLYDGRRFAANHDVVLVSINYRLGTLGWFSHPALKVAATEPMAAKDNSGNYGTLDIIAALEWVQTNISAFGGDPGNVTIFGESAGGWNVMSMVVSPLAAGLYHKAIAQSGGLRLVDMDSAESYVADGGLPRSGREEMNRLLQLDGRATNPEESTAIQNEMSSEEVANFLRSSAVEKFFEPLKPSQDAEPDSKIEQTAPAPFILWSYMDEIPLNLLADGYVLPNNTDVLEVLSDSEKFNATPIILGSNKHETKLFTLSNPWFTHRMFGFPVMVKNKDDYFQSVKYGSLYWKALGVDEIAAVLKESQQPDVYAYRFDWGNLRNLLTLNLRDLLGGAHALELPFVFGNLDLLETALVLADQQAARNLSDSMMSYWAEFAHTGNPAKGRDGDLTLWQSWSNAESEERQIIFDEADYGGVRMSNELVNFDTILAELIDDDTLDSDARCELSQRMFPHLSPRVCSG